MIYFMRNMDKPFITAIDVEYDKEKIIQLGSITLKNIGNNLYQVCRSLNVYIKQPFLNHFVEEYTNITRSFLDSHGVELEEAQKMWNEYMQDFDADDTLVVSHGIEQDAELMKKNGFNVEKFEHWCTYHHSQWVLERTHNLTLSEVLKEGGLIPIGEHNAYADALSTLNALSFLLKIEGDNEV